MNNKIALSLTTIGIVLATIFSTTTIKPKPLTETHAETTYQKYWQSNNTFLDSEKLEIIETNTNVNTYCYENHTYYNQLGIYKNGNNEIEIYLAQNNNPNTVYYIYSYDPSGSMSIDNAWSYKDYILQFQSDFENTTSGNYFKRLFYQIGTFYDYNFEAPQIEIKQDNDLKYYIEVKNINKDATELHSNNETFNVNEKIYPTILGNTKIRQIRRLKGGNAGPFQIDSAYSNEVNYQYFKQLKTPYFSIGKDNTIIFENVDQDAEWIAIMRNTGTSIEPITTTPLEYPENQYYQIPQNKYGQIYIIAGSNKQGIQDSNNSQIRLVNENTYHATDPEYEVIDIGGLMLQILAMPWTFISTAFNLTIFENTPYQINFANIFKGLIAILALLFIIRLFTNGFNAIGNVANNTENRKNTKADTELKKSQTKVNNAKANKIEGKKK